MCDRLVMLARIDHRRWVSCCEHGTTHLAWDNVSVRIPLQKLVAISPSLQECAQVARRFRIAGSGEVCVVYDQYDLYQVWLCGVGLCLSPDEFTLFCRLIQEAGEHPTACASSNQASDAAPTTSDPDAPIRTTYHLFSLN
ncbi:MAG: hypothetical protein IT328_01600 [Caldilineaceae bacterium]|nr:hypothetical protein [Caldilineaceae bacterium]